MWGRFLKHVGWAPAPLFRALARFPKFPEISGNSRKFPKFPRKFMEIRGISGNRRKQVRISQQLNGARSPCAAAGGQP